MRQRTTYHERAARLHAQFPHLSLPEIYRIMAKNKRKSLAKTVGVEEYLRRMVRLGLD